LEFGTIVVSVKGITKWWRKVWLLNSISVCLFREM